MDVFHVMMDFVQNVKMITIYQELNAYIVQTHAKPAHQKLYVHLATLKQVYC